MPRLTGLATGAEKVSHLGTRVHDVEQRVRGQLSSTWLSSTRPHAGADERGCGAVGILSVQLDSAKFIDRAGLLRTVRPHAALAILSGNHASILVPSMDRD